MVHHLPAGNVKVNCGFATKQHDYHQKWWFYNKKQRDATESTRHQCGIIVGSSNMHIYIYTYLHTMGKSIVLYDSTNSM